MKQTRETIDYWLADLANSRLTHWEWTHTHKCRKALEESGEITEYDESILERIYADRA